VRKTINWTQSKNVKIVKQAVKNSPDNLSFAFHNASKILGCSESSVSQAWYNVIRKKATPSFKTTSSKVERVDVKNSPRRVKKNDFIHESVLSSRIYDGMRVVTVKQYYAV
jgi:hypothetical protein